MSLDSGEAFSVLLVYIALKLFLIKSYLFKPPPRVEIQRLPSLSSAILVTEFEEIEDGFLAPFYSFLTCISINSIVF